MSQKALKQVSTRVERLDSALAGKEELIVQLNQQLAARAVERPTGPAAGDAVMNVLPPLPIHLPPTEDPQEPEYPLTKYSLSPSFSLFSIPLDTQNLPPLFPQADTAENSPRREVNKCLPLSEGLSHRAVHQ